MREIRDKNGKLLENGSVIDIGQTVNGQSVFVVETLEPLDIRYSHDTSRKYEYDQEELLKPDRISGETEFEIIGQSAPTPSITGACPFCGSGDVMYTPLYDAVTCNGCDAVGPQLEYDDVTDPTARKAKAIKAWNERKP